MYGDFVTFTPPLSSDAGSYWCRNKTDHSDMAEGLLIFKGSYISIVAMYISNNIYYNVAFLYETIDTL